MPISAVRANREKMFERLGESRCWTSYWLVEKRWEDRGDFKYHVKTFWAKAVIIASGWKSSSSGFCGRKTTTAAGFPTVRSVTAPYFPWWRTYWLSVVGLSWRALQRRPLFTVAWAACTKVLQDRAFLTKRFALSGILVKHHSDERKAGVTFKECQVGETSPLNLVASTLLSAWIRLVNLLRTWVSLVRLAGFWRIIRWRLVAGIYAVGDVRQKDLRQIRRLLAMVPLPIRKSTNTLQSKHKNIKLSRCVYSSELTGFA